MCIRDSLYTFGEDDYGNTIKKIPGNSRYIKSEDILYEIKKIQQKQILSDGMEYDYVKSCLLYTSFLCVSYTISSMDFPVISRPANAYANNPFFGDNSALSWTYSGDKPDFSAISLMIFLS